MEPTQCDYYLWCEKQASHFYQWYTLGSTALLVCCEEHHLRVRNTTT